MSNDSDRQMSRETETLLRSSVPARTTDAELGAVRARVKARRPRVARTVGLTAVAATVLVGALIAATTWRTAPTPHVFAAERAAQMLFPEGAVLHVITQNEAEGRLDETWIDMDGERSRHECSVETSAGPHRKSVQVQADGRYRRLEDRDAWWGWDDPSFPEPTGTAIFDGPHVPGELSDLNRWMLSWAEQADEMIQNAEDGVTDTTTPDGDPAWSVTWTEDLGQMTCTVVMRKLDYQPISLSLEYTGLETAEHFESALVVIEWSAVDPEDVPAETFDLESIQDLDAAFVSESYAFDDPRLSSFSRFPAWRLAEDSGLGPVSSGEYQFGELSPGVMFKDGVQIPEPERPRDLRRFGGLTLEYANEKPPNTDPSAGTVAVITYDNAESVNVDMHWTGRVMDLLSPAETTGELNGRSYRLARSSTDGRATLLTVIGEQTVVITGPSREIVLQAFGALEPMSE